jgi:hypothetical protein
VRRQNLKLETGSPAYAFAKGGIPVLRCWLPFPFSPYVSFPFAGLFIAHLSNAVELVQ